ncbi:MAG: ribulose-phosphate 3-epimerase [Clostridiales bacterium]|jgi:ribulose-phosphate 3-epimerase|nr:ribulose-phosphate 3-epimerase [Clostridiales bacterium]
MSILKLAPSILSADFSKLGEDVRAVEDAGASYLHIDVMDGRFVENITLGPPVIKSIRQASKMIFDVHLMIEEPERFFEAFSASGADIINMHSEAVKDKENAVKAIKKLGKKPAMAIKPDTAATELLPVIEELSLALVMSVEPGFGGQKLMPQTLRKAEFLANYACTHGLELDIEMDGGLCLANVKEALSAGVNVIVAGSAIFSRPDPGKAIRDFHEAFKEFEGMQKRAVSNEGAGFTADDAPRPC